MPFHPCGLRGRPAHPLTAVYLDAAPALRPRWPLDDLAPPFLMQVRGVPSMRHRAEPERWRAVRGAFALGFKTRLLRGAQIAVIVDVMTTGATVSECARCEKRAAPRRSMRSYCCGSPGHRASARLANAFSAPSI